MEIINYWYRLLDMLPFSWAHYYFMKNALLAILLVAPCFALLGTVVVNNRMAFFTDVLGHSALAGVAIGVILGLSDPTLPMIILAISLAIAIIILKNTTKSSIDTLLGVFMAFVVALGIVVLSRQGGFSRYTGYIIGDILTVGPAQIFAFFGIALAIFAYWYLLSSALLLTVVNPSLARSRGIKTFLIESSFAVLLAILVMVSIRLVGILIMNSLLVLPAAASRNIAKDICSYTFLSVAISVFSGVTGLIASYYWGASSGATIVLIACGCYCISLLFAKKHLQQGE